MTQPIRYMERTRRYYEAQGFERPYAWAHHDDIPFQRPEKPLSESTVGIVTTAIAGDDIATVMIGRTARAVPMSEIPASFFTDDLSWDKVTTHTRDRGSYFPFDALAPLAAAGRIGGLAPRYYFVPTEYSQRHTVEADAPATLAACIEDEVDVAILVPL